MMIILIEHFSAVALRVDLTGDEKTLLKNSSSGQHFNTCRSVLWKERRKSQTFDRTFTRFSFRLTHIVRNGVTNQFNNARFPSRGPVNTTLVNTHPSQKDDKRSHESQNLHLVPRSLGNVSNRTWTHPQSSFGFDFCFLHHQNCCRNLVADFFWKAFDWRTLRKIY